MFIRGIVSTFFMGTHFYCCNKRVHFHSFIASSIDPGNFLLSDWGVFVTNVKVTHNWLNIFLKGVLFGIIIQRDSKGKLFS